MHQQNPCLFFLVCALAKNTNSFASTANSTAPRFDRTGKVLMWIPQYFRPYIYSYAKNSNFIKRFFGGLKNTYSGRKWLFFCIYLNTKIINDMLHTKTEDIEHWQVKHYIVYFIFLIYPWMTEEQLPNWSGYRCLLAEQMTGRNSKVSGAFQASLKQEYYIINPDITESRKSPFIRRHIFGELGWNRFHKNCY